MRLYDAYRKFKTNKEIGLIEENLGDIDEVIDAVENNLGKMSEEELQNLLQKDVITSKEITKIYEIE